MRITNILTFAAMMGATMLAGCSNDNEPEVTNVLPEDGAIKVTASVDEIQTKAGLATETLDNFYLWITNASSTDYSYKNVFMKKENDAWASYSNYLCTTPRTMLWQKADQAVTVIAINRRLDYATKYSYTGYPDYSDQSTDANAAAADLLFATASVTPSSPVTTNDIYYSTADQALHIKMNHLLSKLRVNLKFGTALTQDGTVPTISSVMLNGTNTRYAVSLTDGSVTSSNTPGFLIMHKETPATGYAASYEVIAVPQTTGFSIRVTLNNGKGYTYTYGDTKGYTFTGNTLYTLNLTVGKNLVTMGALSAKTWGHGYDGKIETK